MAVGWSLLDPVTGSGGAPACALVESALGKVSTAQTRKRNPTARLGGDRVVSAPGDFRFVGGCNRGAR
jgi:hypothetical protein